MAYQGVTGPLPVGMTGFSGSRNPSQMLPSHLAYVDGLDYEGALLRKEGGATKLNATSLAAVLCAGTHWVPDSSGTEYEVVFLSSGSVKRDTAGAGTFPTTLVAGLNNARDPPPYFLSCGGETIGNPRRLLLFSATNQVQFVNGTGVVMAAIATPAADWAANFPLFGVQHDFRIWAGGNQNDPHRIYYSTTTDHRDFVGAGSGSLPIYPGEGTGLVGGISFRGLLVLFKWPLGVYVVDTTDPTISNWRVDRLSGAVGAVNQHTIIAIENDVLYMDRTGGVHMLSATQAHGDLNTSDITRLHDLQQFMRSSLNTSTVIRSIALYYPAKRQAWFMIPGIGMTADTIRVVGDLQDLRVGPRFTISRRDTAASMWLSPGSDFIYKPMMGDTTGYAWKMDQLARSKDGAGYNFEFETANMDLSFLDPMIKGKAKNGQFLEIVSEPIGDWDLTVSVYWDDVLTETLQFNMGASGAALDSFVLDTDTLGSDTVRSQRRRISGSGRRIKLRAHNDGAGEDVALAEFLLGFELADERTREPTS